MRFNQRQSFGASLAIVIQPFDQLHTSLRFLADPEELMIVVVKLVECGKCGLEDLGGVEAETRRSWLPAF